ncbi:hypothetical protein J7481_19670 [Labrenzia sp. R4_2]|uniref:hypothetical protein n=1 Tax=Labrenzia sp. R4_2 TaxID=2821107 RepID=UPI001ADBCE1B|nr:hypothetical protein [Labrenzia sp. R4_2]MBO9421736.1 hypothetical protein [Labrenzia sp. R4_2]
MPSVYWGEDWGRLKTYAASTKDAKSTVRIELEVTSHDERGWLLKQLEECKRSQKSTRTKTPPGKET